MLNGWIKCVIEVKNNMLGVQQEAFMISVSLNEWKRNFELPTGETVILHNPKVFSTICCIRHSALYGAKRVWHAAGVCFSVFPLRMAFKWKTQLSLLSVCFHQLIIEHQYVSLERPPSPSERTQTRTLKRGVENISVEIPQGECTTTQIQPSYIIGCHNIFNIEHIE